MSEYFRLVRGLEIDDAVRILQGAGAPGTTPDTVNAQVGSLYLESTAGKSWAKIAAGSGTDKWSNASSSYALYAELTTGSPTPPSALALNSVAIGPGAATAVGADGSLALGSQSLSRHQGAQVFANGRFGSTGDAQAGMYMLRTHTTTSAFTEAFLDGTGGTKRLILPDDSTWTFTATITGHRTDVGDGHAGYKVQGVVYRGSGANTISFQGTPTVTVLAESDPSWDINIGTDTINGSLKVEVRGQTGKIIRWAVLIETLEVTN